MHVVRNFPPMLIAPDVIQTGTLGGTYVVALIQGTVPVFREEAVSHPFRNGYVTFALNSITGKAEVVARTA